jgi:hypothetical protein
LQFTAHRLEGASGCLALKNETVLYLVEINIDGNMFLFSTTKLTIRQGRTWIWPMRLNHHTGKARITEIIIQHGKKIIRNCHKKQYNLTPGTIWHLP